MPFTKEDKILNKNLFELKGYSAKAAMPVASTSCNSYVLLGWSTVVPTVADDAAPALILLTNWCCIEMARQELIIICTLYLIIHFIV